MSEFSPRTCEMCERKMETKIDVNRSMLGQWDWCYRGVSGETKDARILNASSIHERDLCDRFMPDKQDTAYGCHLVCNFSELDNPNVGRVEE